MEESGAVPDMLHDVVSELLWLCVGRCLGADLVPREMGGLLVLCAFRGGLS